MGFQPSPTKETVIVVHGTFAGPGAEGVASWWERGGTFCDQVDRALEEYGSTARCWANEGECFGWSGANNWAARAKAASELRAYIDRVIRQGWTCHVVAHSHGGSVLLDALRDMHGWPAPCGLGWLCTLGTPYLNLKARPLWPFTVNARPFMCAALLAALTLAMVAFGAFSAHPWWSSVLLTALVVLAILGGMMRLVSGISVPGNYDLTDTPSGSERLLAIGCAEDEAFRFLSELKKQENPLPAMPFKPALAFRESVRTARALDAIRFSSESSGILWRLPAALVHVLVIPIRSILLIGSVGRSWILALVRPLGRTPAWNVVQSELFGVGGSPVGVDQVEVSHEPAVEAGVPFVYEKLEKSIVLRAVSRRSVSACSTATHIGRALNALSEGGDIFAPLRDVLVSVELIHASYYQDDFAIERIAVWLSMPAKERLLRAARVHDENNLEFSLEKRMPAEDREAHVALMNLRADLSELERKYFDKRSQMIHRYRGCCHASESYGATSWMIA